ncbi:hypothetical protein AXF42_Ash004216 [Apostasia shenzhenica]|uniref:Uncharacterized protein n=1 Tax=Apostasia shenzhenica TaxID=1088818 RepID=A0A2I0A2B1_9ASPA|nr:hypothetical protein AXF42_Ash004216 [Apostasia shenzhenica]
MSSQLARVMRRIQEHARRHLASFPGSERMLSFSSSKPKALILNGEGALSFYHYMCQFLHPLPASSLLGTLLPSQWMELE